MENNRVIAAVRKQIQVAADVRDRGVECLLAVAIVLLGSGAGAAEASPESTRRNAAAATATVQPAAAASEQTASCATAAQVTAGDSLNVTGMTFCDDSRQPIATLSGHLHGLAAGSGAIAVRVRAASNAASNAAAVVRVAQQACAGTVVQVYADDSIDVTGMTFCGDDGDTIARMDGSINGIRAGSGDVQVRVRPGAVAVGSVAVSPAAETIAPGETLQLSAKAFDGDGNAVAGSTFAWSSNDASVATVDSSGLVRGVAFGTARIAAAAGSVSGTAEITVEHPDRTALSALYRATDGPNWTNNEGWLTDAPLGEWHGVTTDASGRVTHLSFGYWTSNGLVGRLPPELGNLSSLRELILANDRLAGPIPSELGNLSSLRELFLHNNQLAGPIPPELGELANLIDLQLQSNRLTGAVPKELGNLANLKYISIDSNGLSGALPRSFTGLHRIMEFYFDANAGLCAPGTSTFFTWERQIRDLRWGHWRGPYCNEADRRALEELYDASSGRSWTNADGWLLTPVLEEWHGVTADSLGRVVTLDLAGNGLSGRLPSGLGGLAEMTGLRVGDNALSHLLPFSLSNLPLAELRYANTTLCVPDDADFRTWLLAIPAREGPDAACRQPEDREVAYLTQAVQSQESVVPLVAGEKALLRVFPTTLKRSSAGIPAVRATFHVDGEQTRVVDIPGKSTPLPNVVDKSDLAKSANAEIPASVIQPGLEMVIEIYRHAGSDPALEVGRRVPEEGRIAVEVATMPSLDLTVIPFVWSQTGDTSIVKLVEDMAANPETHDLLHGARALLPVGDFRVTAHEAVESTSNDIIDLYHQTDAIRAMEGGAGHYLGLIQPPATGAAGAASLPGRVSSAVTRSSTIAHELGHNMNLSHSPCGGAGGVDPAFPYPDGSIGVWGYDFRGEGGLVDPSTADVMGNCVPAWISHYHFTKALRFRQSRGSASSARGAAVAPGAAASARSLLLWGGAGRDGRPFLEPVFVIDAPASLPASAGEHRLAGRSARGGELFSLSFAMPAVADGDGQSRFVFVLPVPPAWEGDLASVTLSGPGGAVTLDGESDLPMTIVRDPRNGRVRAMLRDPTVLDADRARAEAASVAGPGLEVLRSRGIPDAADWRR